MYRFYTVPYKHQKRALILALKLGSLGILMDPGCGKSKVAVDYIGCRHIMGQADRILIMAPKSVLGVWEEEIETHLPPEIKRTVVRLEGTKRLATMNKHKNTKGLVIFLITYDSAWRMQKELLKLKPDMTICDESHFIANPTSKRSKFVHKVGKISRWRGALTGTFLPNGVLGVYSQMKFINPDEFDMTWTEFKDRYGTWYKPKGKYFKIFKKPKRTKELNKKVLRNAISVTKDQALDLPERQDILIPVEMSAKGWKYYKQMEKDKIIKFKKGKAKAKIILTELIHFQQITGGFLKVDTGEFDHLDRPIKEDVFIHSDKLNALNELIDIHMEYKEKMLIFCHYTWEFNQIFNLLRKKKLCFSGISGKTKNRDEIRRGFQAGAYDVLVIQIAAGGIGITLTAANIVIFYSTNQRLDHYLQAKDRVHRPGQKKKVIIYHLAVKGTIDETIMQSHIDKKHIADMITTKNWEEFI